MIVKRLSLVTEKSNVDIDILQQAQKNIGSKCMTNVADSSKKSMKILLMEAEIDFERKKVLIENRLNMKKSCSDYASFLKHQSLISDNINELNIDFKKLNTRCKKEPYVLYERANKAYNKGKYDLAHKLSAQSCNSKKAIGCELLGILIKKELSKIAMGIPANQKRGKIIYYLEKGHKAGDDKSSAMLFDIYNGGFLFGNVEKANKLIDYLSSRESKAAEIRLKLDCLSNRENNPLKFLCRNVRVYARGQRNK